MRSVPLWPAMVLVLASSCSVQTTGLGGATGPAPQDATAADASTDASVSGTGRAPDAGTQKEDAGRPQDDGGLREPDAAVGMDASVRPSCDELYDGTNGYFLCEQRPDECEFFADLQEDSCDDACGAGTVAGMCTGNHGNGAASGPDRCRRTEREYFCDSDYTDHICVCSRP